MWNWNIFTSEIFIPLMKWERFFPMKYIIRMWSELVRNFTCEILVYATSVSYMKWKISHMKNNFTYEIFISHMDLKQFTFEILF